MKRYWFVSITAIFVLIVALMPVKKGSAQGGSPVPRPGAPQATMPVFRLTAPAVNQGSISELGALFPGIGSNTLFSDTTHVGSLRFTIVNTQTGISLEQFAASGGFFVTNVRRAFSETPAILDYGPDFVCNFLQSKGLFPAKATPPQAMDCTGGQLPYREIPIYLSIVTPTMRVEAGMKPDLTQAVSTVIPIGLVYQVPLAIDVGVGAPNYIPLTGPGGHLSVLLTGFGDNESLDPQYPGLNAIASPFYGRQFTKIGDYPILSAREATDQLRAGLPPGTVITPGTPTMAYYVDHPAVTQTTMIPMWVFTGAVVNIDGQEVPLKTPMLPAVTGFLPEVRINSPADNTPYFPGTPLTVTGLLTSSMAGPFTYTLSVDGGGTLDSGVWPVTGTFQLNLATLPFSLTKAGWDNLTLRLSVTDNNGAVGEDAVLLLGPHYVYLPLILRTTGNGRLVGPQPAPPERAAAPNTAPTMGVEWIQYYNGTAPNLPGVPPDANGFYNRLRAAGWSGRFNYGNNVAWEKDWRDCSLGGIDCSWGVDRVQYVYFAGHGSPARIYFGVNKDNYSFFGGNARYQNVRWASFSSCQTLRAGPYIGPGNPPLTNWFNAFQGAYMLLGFHSNMADVAFGGPLVDNMRLPVMFGIVPLYFAQRSIREAWVLTAFQMNAGKPAYLYAVGNFNPVNFKLPDAVWHNYSTPPLTGITQYRWVWWD
ncbi:MAG: hypothetical protein D6768_08740 [Chloroflexi bacterium]|nr:MAG: hypothetical protein D6768_08740 [Chloroflexota bacterium]